jgi:energy-coupling factor transporter ATP-binding protein EcfA2
MLPMMSEGTQNGSGEGHAVDEPPRQRARLRRLTIQRFRNVRPTTLIFDDEWNVLLGKNGTGKTTLLELIAATLRGDLKALIALDPEVELQAELSFGPATLTWQVERGKTSDVPLAATAPQGLRLNRTERPDRASTVRVYGDGLFSYEMKGTQEGFDGHGGATFVTKADSEASFAFALVLGHRDASTEPVWENKPLQRAIAAASRAADVIRFDELLTVFRNIGPEGKLSIVRVFGIVRGPFCSEELAKAVDDESERASEQTEGGQISLGHEKLGFLKRFVELCGFEAGWLQLADLGRRRVGGMLVPEFGRPSFLFRRRNQEELREEHLSFGQKRLLSFLYYTTLADPIVADELVDGLHYDWIEACVNEVRGRQKFFASQNPLLVDHMGFKKAASVRSRFLRCTVEGDELIWSNLSEAEADDFFVAYRTGISAVSDVLRRKGLW